ncbi:MAG: ABC transporter substrate-binding protein [Burkholderiaceae bacterium]|nr:ABC transporter substrate-binding protein [Burkholderiaceae bacterium]
MRRRLAMCAMACAVPAASHAAPARDGKVARIAMLVPAPQQARAAGIVKALGPLGWQVGRNLHVELRVSDAPPLLDAHAAEVVALGVDLIVALQTPAVLAAHRATRRVPIVMAGAAIDPVAGGLAQSLAVPGGKLTGITVQGAHLAGKSLEIVSELRTPTRNVGLLANGTDPFTRDLLTNLQQAAAALRVRLHTAEVGAPAQYEAAFATWAAARTDAVFVQPSLAIERAAMLALAHRLPSFSFVRGYVSAGGLLAYAANPDELARQSVDYIDRILRGADPGVLPIVQSSSFDLSINLRTAKALGLQVPRALMLRASEVLE